MFGARAVALGLHGLTLFFTLRTERSSPNVVLLESQGHTDLLRLLQIKPSDSYPVLCTTYRGALKYVIYFLPLRDLHSRRGEAQTHDISGSEFKAVSEVSQD